MSSSNNLSFVADGGCERRRPWPAITPARGLHVGTHPSIRVEYRPHAFTWIEGVLLRPLDGVDSAARKLAVTCSSPPGMSALKSSSCCGDLAQKPLRRTRATLVGTCQQVAKRKRTDTLSVQTSFSRLADFFSSCCSQTT